VCIIVNNAAQQQKWNFSNSLLYYSTIGCELVYNTLILAQNDYKMISTEEQEYII